MNRSGYCNTNILPPPPKGVVFGDVILHLERIVPGDASHGHVPYYHFRIIDSAHCDVGHLNFRVGDFEHVRLTADHIGYGVKEEHRGRGYARQACVAVAPCVRLHYDNVIVTSDPDNAASIRTIEGLGATSIDVVKIPTHEPQYLRGSRLKRRYQWSP